jgi:hypothetical protein
MPRKRLLVWLGIGTAAAAAATWLPQPPLASDARPPARIEAARADTQAERAQLRWASLPDREMIGAPAGEPFSPFAWTAAQAAAGAGVALSKPAVPYRVAGKVVHESEEILLGKGNAVIAVREGDELDDGYRVESIKSDHVILLNVPLGVRETLSMSSTFIIDETYDADASPTAELRWEGPELVKAGDAFNVALKLSAPQAVRAMPMQLNFDAALLRAVDVRPGALFAGGSFSYVIDSGSILVGASGKASVAADAEILVVTFKPLRPGAAAELNLSSMRLEGAAGGAIAHKEPAAFRTAILH